jgi:hypothetical protein
MNPAHDTSLGPGQQSCEILFKFIKRVRSYGADKLFACVFIITCIMTLTFYQWPWIKVVTFGSSVRILWNIIPIHAFSENLWLGQNLNHYEHSDLDLWLITLNQGHDTSLRPRQQSFEILFKFIKRVRSYGADKLFACVFTITCIMTLTFYQWPWIKVVTLPWVQCKNSVKLFQSMLSVKTYGLTMFKPLWA